MAGLASFVQGFQGGVDVAHSWADRKRNQKFEDEDRAYLAENRDWARGDRAYTLEERARLRKEEDRQLKAAQDERDAAAAAFGGGQVEPPATTDPTVSTSGQTAPLLPSGAQTVQPGMLGRGLPPEQTYQPGMLGRGQPTPSGMMGRGFPATGPATQFPTPAPTDQPGMMGRGQPSPDPRAAPGQTGRSMAPPMPASFAQSQIGRQIAAQNGTTLEAAWAGMAEADQQPFYQMAADPSLAGAPAPAPALPNAQAALHPGYGPAPGTQPPAAVLTGQPVAPYQPPARPQAAIHPAAVVAPATTAPAPASMTSGGGNIAGPTGAPAPAGRTLSVTASATGPGSAPPAAVAPNGTPIPVPGISQPTTTPAVAGDVVPPVPAGGVAATPQGQGTGRKVTPKGARTPENTAVEVGALANKQVEGMQQMVDYYMKTGQFDKAKAMKDWMGTEKTQASLTLWAKSAHSYMIGDEKGMLDSYAAYYNSLDLGVKVDRAKSKLTRDPATNQVTGVDVTYEDADGNEQQTHLSMADVFNEGIMATDPKTIFDTIHAQQAAGAAAALKQQDNDTKIIIAQIRAAGLRGAQATPARVHKAMSQLQMSVPNFANLPLNEKVRLAVEQLNAEDQAAAAMGGIAADAAADTGELPVAYGAEP